jgi:hypothetical protein
MLPQIEKAIYIPTSNKEVKYFPGYNRIYYGNEFCEHLMPGIAQILEVLDLCYEKNLGFSFLTPYVTDNSFAKLEKIFDILSQKYLKAEVIINDFGVLEFIKERNYNFTLVLGRLLNRQKRGPRLIRLLNKLPREAIEHFSLTYLDRFSTLSFLKKLGIERVEFDNLSIGLTRPTKDVLKASLYYPYIYISTTRLCPTAKAFKDNFRLRKIETCKNECQKYHFILKHKSFSEEIILKGNTYFYYEEKIPQDLIALNIDRIVYQPQIPM